MYLAFTRYKLLALLLTTQYIQGDFGGEIWKGGGGIVFSMFTS